MPAAAAALGVCMVLASAPNVTAQFIPVQAFTLAWTHSIEKVRWEEDYSVILEDGTAILQAGRARIKGSAAGMEPPPDARVHDGWYDYQPDPHPAVPLRLTRSIYTPDFDWCHNGRCLPLSAIRPNDGGITLLYPCQGRLPPPG